MRELQGPFWEDTPGTDDHLKRGIKVVSSFSEPGPYKAFPLTTLAATKAKERVAGVFSDEVLGREADKTEA